MIYLNQLLKLELHNVNAQVSGINTLITKNFNNYYTYKNNNEQQQ